MKLQSTLMPSSLQILVSLFFAFGNIGCLIFFTMVSVCKARQARLLKNVNKNFITSLAHNNKKEKQKWDEKLINVRLCADFCIVTVTRVSKPPIH